MSSTFSISSGSPLILSAIGMSEPSSELKNDSGSKSEPRARAAESPASVSASAGRSSPVMSESWLGSSSESDPAYGAA